MTRLVLAAIVCVAGYALGIAMRPGMPAHCWSAGMVRNIGIAEQACGAPGGSSGMPEPLEVPAPRDGHAVG